MKVGSIAVITLLFTILSGCASLTPRQLEMLQSAAGEVLESAPESLSWTSDAEVQKVYQESRRDLENLASLKRDRESVSGFANRMAEASLQIDESIWNHAGTIQGPSLEEQHLRLGWFYECRRDCRRLWGIKIGPTGEIFRYPAGLICDFGCYKVYR